MGSRTVDPRMTTPLLHVCILSSLLYLSIGFHTDTCNHSQVVDTLASYKTCVKNNATRIDTNLCSFFNVTKTCAQEAYRPCYGADAKLIASNLVINKAKALRTADLHEIFTCPEAPSKQETDNYTGRLFIMLDFTDTDENCSKNTIDKVQLGLPSCITNSSAHFEREIVSRVNRARGNLKNFLCNILYETYGECWRIEFPTCFTEREITFIKDEIDYTVQTVFDAMVKSPRIDLVKCLQHGSSASSTNSQTLHIVLLCVLLGTFLLPRTNNLE